uniref:ABC transporter permease n=1 Tax=Roseihalotalea indica TaxID=2867963 RepID=A0AA49GMW1_9BACT|nr:ABC transporter permease [Tunicatimonas sp. TK19036]
MLKNYLKVALRNLWKRKAQTLINVLGLSLGLASAIVIFLIVRYELSFDRFHTKVDRVYRIVTDFKSPDGEGGNSGVPRPLPEALRQDFPDVFAQIVPVEEYQNHRRVKVGDKTLFLDEMIAYTETGYLQLFDFPLLEGNAEKALSLPNEVLITQAVAQTLFGRSSDVVGEVINLNDMYELKVAGVLADLPAQTDLAFEMLISFSTIVRNRLEDEEWDNYNSAFQVYALLNEKTSPGDLQAQLTNYLSSYTADSDGWDAFLRLQPLTSIHHEGKYGGVPHRKAPHAILNGLLGLGAILVLLACINFINLATAVSTRRSKEIGVRKVVGSSRRQIAGYFLGEAFLVTVLATALALGLAEVSLIQLQHLYDYLQNVHLVIDLSLMLFLLILVLVVTLLAGGYPALLLSRFRPVQMFKTYLHAPQRNRLTVRRILVVFQFFAAQLFIVSVLVVGQQLQYLLEAPLGFNRQAILTLNFPDDDPQKQQRFKQTLQNHTGVEALSLSGHTAISQSRMATLIGYDGKSKEGSEDFAYYQFADADYFTTHQMTFLAGGTYPPSDSGSGFVANEAFVREVGATSPEEVIGKYVAMNDLALPIVGVVADYHTYTFDSQIPPLLITNYSPGYHYLNLKVNMVQADAVVKQLQQSWQESYPEFEFHYRFLDEALEGFYANYQRLLSLTQLFSGIAIAIGCLGLYGLVLFMAEQRTKEIGIRKVLGASVQQLLMLFSGEFLKLVLIAFCLAAPLAYFMMRQWLQSFEYRISIGLTIFVGCLLITLLLVMVTVGYRATRAALANPVDSLRNE